MQLAGTSVTDSTLSHTRHTDGKGGAAAATAAAVRGRSSDCLQPGRSLLRAGARRLRRVARQARGQGASVPLVAAQGYAEVASGGRRRERFARREAAGDGAVGGGARE